MKKDLEDKNRSVDMGQGRVKKIKRTWDFLCVSTDGRIIHFSNISGKLSAFCAVCLVVLIFSVVLTGFYIYQRKEFVMLTAKFIDLEGRFQDVSKERDEFAAKIALSEKKSSDQPVIPKAPQQDDKISKNTENVETSPKADAMTDASDLQISDFSARRGGGSVVNLRFNLKSKTGSQALVKGHIISALMPSPESESSAWKLSPDMKLKDEKPESPEKGQYFSLKGDKEITVRLKASASFKAVKVFVYDDAKKSFAENVVKIEDAPKKEKKKQKRK